MEFDQLARRRAGVRSLEAFGYFRGNARDHTLWFAKMSSHARRLRISNIRVDV
jgi:hypothetical protein